MQSVHTMSSTQEEECKPKDTEQSYVRAAKLEREKYEKKRKNELNIKENKN